MNIYYKYLMSMNNQLTEIFIVYVFNQSWIKRDIS